LIIAKYFLPHLKISAAALKMKFVSKEYIFIEKVKTILVDDFSGQKIPLSGYFLD
jgi:hypothetical protein